MNAQEKAFLEWEGDKQKATLGPVNNSVTSVAEQGDTELVSPFELVDFCAGYGRYHSDGGASPKPLDGIQWHDIADSLASPSGVDKLDAPWAIFSSIHTRSADRLRKEALFYVAWLDFDENPPAFDKMPEFVSSLIDDSNVYAYTSRSATESHQKSRALMPLAEPATADEFALIQECLNDRMEGAGLTPDRVTERVNQICFLPNRGEFYEHAIVSEGRPLDWRKVLADDLDEKRSLIARENERLEKARQDAVARQQSRKASYSATGQVSPIDLYNETYGDLRDAWTSYGAKWKGRRGLSPLSSSGAPAIVLSPDRKLWYSHHGSDRAAGIGVPSENGGCWGDAFDLFVHFEHGGDRDKAIRAAGDMLTVSGVSVTKHNQRQHMQAKENADTQKALDDVASHAGGDESGEKKPFSLAAFSLAGKSQEMKAKMMEDVFVLDGLAIAGQMTCFYAKPNSGKTLLTLRLLIDAVKAGAVKGKDVYYINADDNYRGLVTKLELAEENNFHMLAPGHNGFGSAMFAEYLAKMTKEGTAQDTIIVLDTLKKFTDLMDKQAGSRFMNHVREFNSHGGTVIMLAHTNKHRDSEGKLVFAGTSDVVDDIDCAYIIDALEVGPLDTTKTVVLENFKSRGDVAQKVSYRYSVKTGQHYHDLVKSVEKVSDEEAQQAQERDRIAKELEKNKEVIDVLVEAMGTDAVSQPDMLKAAADAGIGRRTAIKVLKRHAGPSWADGHRWEIVTGERNAKFYRRVTPLNDAYIPDDELDEYIEF